MQQVPWLKHHPQLRGCELRPHLIRDAGGLLSPFHMEGGQQGQEHWESTPRHPIHPPTPPRPVLPTAVPIHITLSLHHPTPSTPSSVAPLAFHPYQGGDFSSMGTAHFFQKRAPGGAQTTGKASSVPGWVAKAPCPMAPTGPGTTHTHPLPQAPRFVGCVLQAGSHSQPSATGFP